MWKTPRRKLKSCLYNDCYRHWANTVVVANSKIYQIGKDLDGSSLVAILSAETGETLSTLVLNLGGGPLYELQGPEGQGVMEPVKWIAIRTQDANNENRLMTEQILILNLETNEIRTIYLIR